MRQDWKTVSSGVVGALLMYDITKHLTYKDMEHWLKELGAMVAQTLSCWWVIFGISEQSPQMKYQVYFKKRSRLVESGCQMLM